MIIASFHFIRVVFLVKKLVTTSGMMRLKLLQQERVKQATDGATIFIKLVYFSILRNVYI